MASVWDFFGIPNPDPGDSGSVFLILSKIEKSRVKNLKNPGDGDRDFKSSRKSRNPRDRDRDLKIPKKFREENPENPGNRFSDHRDFLGFYENTREFRQILGIRAFIPGIRDFFSLGIFMPWILIF